MLLFLCARTFHVDRLSLYIFTGCYTYLPKIHVYRTICIPYNAKVVRLNYSEYKTAYDTTCRVSFP